MESKWEDAFYFGMYLALDNSSKGYSQPESTPTNYVSLSGWRTRSKARGAGYDLACWNKYDYIACLFVLFFGSTNGQNALGQGYVNGSARQNNTRLTYDNDYGMSGSTSSDTTRMAFLWINDYWGNMYQYMGGMGATSDWRMWYSDVSTTTATSNVVETGIDLSTAGYVTKILGDEHGVTLPIIKIGGSSSTYMCDWSSNSASGFPFFGGRWDDTTSAGPFQVRVVNSATNTTSNTGARLQYSILVGDLDRENIYS